MGSENDDTSLVNIKLHSNGKAKRNVKNDITPEEHERRMSQPKEIGLLK